MHLMTDVYILSTPVKYGFYLTKIDIIIHCWINYTHIKRLYFNSIMKQEEKIEIRAYIKAQVALHISPKEIFSELCPIDGSSAVMLRTVYYWVIKFQMVNVV